MAKPLEPGWSFCGKDGASFFRNGTPQVHSINARRIGDRVVLEIDGKPYWVPMEVWRQLVERIDV